MKEQKFFRCSHCGNMVAMMFESGARIVCCGEEMAFLDPNTKDGAREKHIPEVEIKGDEVRVQIGSVIHPMTEAHYIEWVYVQTDKGGHVHYFNPGDEPICRFRLVDEKVVAVFEYCNLHGLYKVDL